MTSIALALVAAVAYGLSDFVGGLFSRRTSVWPVGLLACVGSLAGPLVLLVVREGDPQAGDWLWGAAGGVGSGLGTAFLYRGLSSGRMGVVAPVSAVGAVLLPLAAGLLGGERPGVLAWLGIAVALPGIWLVAREEAEPGVPAVPVAAGLLDGIVAGVGFGLLFAALGQLPEASGYGPVVLCQLSSIAAVALAAFVLGGDPLPRERIQLVGLGAGLLASAALVFFVLAQQAGLLSISALITSLYPAVTVLLAVVVLREHVHRSQLLGLGLCAGTVVLVGLGS